MSLFPLQQSGEGAFGKQHLKLNSQEKKLIKRKGKELSQKSE